MRGRETEFAFGGKFGVAARSDGTGDYGK